MPSFRCDPQWPARSRFVGEQKQELVNVPWMLPGRRVVPQKAEPFAPGCFSATRERP